ncbi:PqiC family protein [Pseudooceanicola lipolyticus]|nr:ABC-type transport auxiliary lipoprotein family protein [Pseudooceanicola lipolyticus]
MMSVLRALMLIPFVALAGCGGQDARYLLDSPMPQRQSRVPLSTIEVREVTLPAYASATEIMVQDPDGALRPVPRSAWADDPVRALTLALARNLDAASSATAMGEPWPLEQPADVRIDVRIEHIVAQSDGQFRLAGQYSVASPDFVVRESINRFDILQPLADTTPASVAAASGAAVLALADLIVARLRR